MGLFDRSSSNERCRLVASLSCDLRIAVLWGRGVGRSGRRAIRSERRRLAGCQARRSNRRQWRMSVPEGNCCRPRQPTVGLRVSGPVTARCAYEYVPECVGNRLI